MTRTLLERPPEQRTTTESRNTWLALGLLVLGVGAATVSLLGPLGLEWIRYHVSEGARTQIIGGDIAALMLMAPVSIAAGILVLSGRSSGLVLGMGPAFYALYMDTQLSLGGDIARYAGNSERFFPLYLGLVVVAGAIAIGCWTRLTKVQLPLVSDLVRCLAGRFSLVVAGFLAVGLHLPGLLDAWRDQPQGTEYLADPVVFWLVKLMDLAFVVPALVAIGIGALRHHKWAQQALYGAAGWMALLGSSVAGMAIAMQIEGDPAASFANTVAFGTFAAIAIGIAASLYWPLVSSTQRGSTKHPADPR